MFAALDPWILSFSALTVLATIGMGYWAARKAKTASDFFVAGRGVSVGWNASAISGEYLSAASFMGIAGMVMSSGYDALWYPVCYACGYLFLLLFIAGPLRRFGAYTIPDFAEGRYDSPIFRKIAVVFVLFIGFFYTMPQMKGAGTTLAYIFPGMPYWAGVVLVGAVITFNVAIGGMKGITLVQAFQYWLKMFAISVPVFVLMSVYGGYGKQLGKNTNLEPRTSNAELRTVGLSSPGPRELADSPLPLPDSPSAPATGDLVARPAFLDLAFTLSPPQLQSDEISGGRRPVLRPEDGRWGKFVVGMSSTPAELPDHVRKLLRTFQLNIRGVRLPAPGLPLDVVMGFFYRETLLPTPDTFTVYFAPGLDGSAVRIRPLVDTNTSPATPLAGSLREILAANGFTVGRLSHDTVKVFPSHMAGVYSQLGVEELEKSALGSSDVPTSTTVGDRPDSRSDSISDFENGKPDAQWLTAQRPSAPTLSLEHPAGTYGVLMNVTPIELARIGLGWPGRSPRNPRDIEIATHVASASVTLMVGNRGVNLPSGLAAAVWRRTANNGLNAVRNTEDPVLRQPLPAKAPTDANWLNPFGPLTTKAAKAAKLQGDAVKPYALLYTYSLIIALVCGTAGLPHILVRFYTNPDGVAAKRTTMWVMILIGVFYVFPPVFGVMGRNLMPALYGGTGAKGTDKVVLELPRVLDQRREARSEKRGNTAAGVPDITGSDPLPPSPADSLAHPPTGSLAGESHPASEPARQEKTFWGSILSGITCAGAFAAFMSTFSGLLVSMTGALAHDVYGRMLRPKSTAADRMRMFKWCAALTGGVATLLGCFVEPLEINFMVGQAFAIAAASYFPLLFMSVWWRGMTIRGAATGMLAGGSCALVAVALTNASNLALDKGPMGRLFSVFAPLNDYWATHPLLRILCEQPAIWTVPLAIGLMIVVSRISAATIPANIRMKMLVLHAPEKLGLKQDYIREHEAQGH